VRQPDLPAIGNRLAHVRAQASQRAHADALGVPLRTYQNYERGEREPDVRTLLALQERGWRVDWLLTGDGPERLDATGVAESDRPAYGSQEMSGETLMVATELADEALAGLWLPSRRRFDLVALIYDALVKGLPYAEIIAFARPAAQDLAGGMTDDRGTEVGGESEGAAGRGAAA
jgi:transcriptional regulator with XRE-family HTH domain